jgi:hypothetical protein
MSKLIFLITLLALTSAIISKQYWECDSRGRYVCLTSQTCCQSKISSSGWACFNLTNAVCCNDGMSACPYGYICNLRAKTCDRRAFLFGEKDSQCELYTEGLEPIDNFKLFKGFMDGIAIFEGKTHHTDKCTEKDLEVVEEVILEIINIIRTVDLKDPILVLVKLTKLFTKFGEFYHSLDKITGPCQEHAQELQVVMRKAIQHVEDPLYLLQLPTHLYEVMGDLKTTALQAAEDYNLGHYQSAGKGYGNLVHDALLWDFE